MRIPAARLPLTRLAASRGLKGHLMLVLGLLLIVIGIGGGGLIFMGTSQITDQVTINMLGGSFGLPPLTLFLAGAIAMLMVWLGWTLLRFGTKRKMRNRRAAKEANARPTSNGSGTDSWSTTTTDDPAGATLGDRP